MNNPIELAKHICQDLWSMSGETPENCLYSFIELFIFKLLSDAALLAEPYNFNALTQRFEEDCDDTLLKQYALDIRPRLKALFPEGEDKTSMIKYSIFVNASQTPVRRYASLFKRTLVRLHTYGTLERIEPNFINALFEHFSKWSLSRKNFGQFFTPLTVVRAMVAMANDHIKPGITICDPACGVGTFLLQALEAQRKDFYTLCNAAIHPKMRLYGFDKGLHQHEQKTIVLAKVNSLLDGLAWLKQHPKHMSAFTKLTNESFVLKTHSILGTLGEPIEDRYDLILTNPPYVTNGSYDLKEAIRKNPLLTSHYQVRSVGVEGLFMEWIIKALKPNGKAFIVIPDGLLHRGRDQHLRRFILASCLIDAIISLPPRTFPTTFKKTYILCLTKKIDDLEQINPVFTYLVSETGESRDSHRVKIEQDDLSKAVASYALFKANQEVHDARCKIQPIKTFQDNVAHSWIIDDAWSTDEKIHLGAIAQPEIMSIGEFPDFLDSIAKNVQQLKQVVVQLNGLSSSL